MDPTSKSDGPDTQSAGRSHSFPLLAAASTLRKEAKKWYLSQPGRRAETWTELQAVMRKTSASKIPFTVLMQRVEARKCNATQESFRSYAIDKLSLLHNMNLPTEDVLNLLIGGITFHSLRVAAAALKTKTVEEFIEEMRHITATADVTRRITGATDRNVKNQEHCKKCGRRGHVSKDCRSIDRSKAKGENKKDVKLTDITCYQCRKTAHYKSECLQLQTKLGVKTEAASQAKVSAVEVGESSHEEDEESKGEAVQPVAAVQEREKQLTTCNNPINVTLISNVKCNISALIDTDSPVSFVREDIFRKFVSRDRATIISSKRKFTALNNLPIDTCGVVKTRIEFEQWPGQLFNIELQIFKGKEFTNAIIIGRDFLRKEKITIVYKPHLAESEEQLQLLSKFNVCEVSKSLASKVDD
ncbi:uncharacterized protein LOC118644345 [Monomorium pharaonis]|uniref:uncharacterized protein LOC118644345 n=1 Tax=Monomorium pharaonis TaxID=307658 RepID=UPI00063EE514|nr:uncharacterized protein LOC118644345 [Monomorium pharaonis]XP_036138620.1 uncharacterized protein LOC118644345 [Monomorium pharaonis]XP_036138621.1 uncharacterized protein LOC118644345 [Monomorium pharaonis]